jgi:hypothetical protein
MAPYRGLRARGQADPSERERVARRPEEPERSGPSDLANVLLSLQGSAGNQAVSNLVQRRVMIAPSTAWATRTGRNALPPMPDHFVAEYQPYVIEQVNALAAQWRDDQNEGRFASADDFYRRLFNHVVRRGTAPAAPTNASAWNVLGDAVTRDGQVTEVKWSNFNPAVAGNLQTELENCKVQLSSNPATTACHANAHGKLPKKVAGPNGELVSELKPSEQPKYTPYVEFLVTGHKSENGIERGILDRVSGLIYLTAHYDVGSIAWLSGAPGGLVSNWSQKARTYTQTLRKYG